MSASLSADVVDVVVTETVAIAREATADARLVARARKVLLLESSLLNSVVVSVVVLDVEELHLLLKLAFVLLARLHPTDIQYQIYLNGWAGQ